ncbi:MAG: polyribonucleotide nucleotidyltransferase [Bacteroidetes bacterium]|nr:polyribonucleotide nucleotidyltransferase [Bacteroidota bacterium]
MVVKKALTLSDGRILSIEAGKVARQANGSVMVSLADTVVLVTVCANEGGGDKLDYFPLQVEFREKASAAGKIPGGFFKREGKPSEKEILSARLIDRALRPLFPNGYREETQVVVSVFSSDQENDADVLGGIGASAALITSDIPFNGPITEVRVGRIDGAWVAFPTLTQLKSSDFDMSIAGSDDSIVMVEGEMSQVSEAEVLDAIKFAHETIRKVNALQREVVAEYNKQKRDLILPEVNQTLLAEVKALAFQRLFDIYHKDTTKQERNSGKKAVYVETEAALAEKYPGLEKTIHNFVHDFEYEIMREMILSEQKRLDGRDLVTIRPISIELGLLPRTHGSALFTRGETQSLTAVTLGSKKDAQTIDDLMGSANKRFMLHYNFPPFSVGEVGRMSGVGRREVGHGNLAERAVKKVVPDEATFPYTLRVISDILESNGSSSMATVCAATLALMDAGVPIKKPVAGIAMGLIKEGDRFAILSDILGDEDHLGDMDFKVAGTSDGITAIQMDIKITGITYEIMEKALAQAKAGRTHILGRMFDYITTPKSELSAFAPRMYTMYVPTDTIGMIIGPGGKNIRGIIEDCKVEINIEDSGLVTIAASNKEAADAAILRIKSSASIFEIGEVFDGIVKRIVNFGAFVEIAPGKEGLLHISAIDHGRPERVEDVLQVGDVVQVKLMKIDGQRLELNRKILLPKPEKQN